ncbi:hypothetical protein [Streptomyces bohaiensis]|uniref:Uncharacterized protein n=1 Tax=Streptomyces bohaiensis TaxID=1431344 RepID=A0ABX1C7S4_9ACTN|nr:hypothetical protein [Streptomyces bohaiensis]NJQ14133.1 hypothetical protein [Streptomyces bohaiensis]
MFEDISFANSDREAAEDAARELFNHVKDLGVRLDDIDVLDPCDGCRRTGYLVHLGNLSTDEVATLNAALRSRAAGAAGPDHPLR